MSMTNSRCLFIKFTFEIGKQEQQRFLYVTFIENCPNKLEFDVSERRLKLTDIFPEHIIAA